MRIGLLFFFIFLRLIITGQSPRLSLYEEFTGENCATCATINNGLDAILTSATNTPLVTFIKWMAPLPTAPTTTWSLYQTNKSDIDWRYKSAANGGYGYSTQVTQTSTPMSGITTAPMGLLDGKHQWSFGASNNNPSSLNSSVISAAQSQTSAFSISMSSSWDVTYSALNLSVTILATASFTANGLLIFRTVMVENEINFNSSPGTNNEKKFRNVAVAAFPTLQTGISMAPTWSVNQSQTFTMSCQLPAYIRDKSQIALIGFIQDDGNKRIEQAAQTSATLFSDDVKALSALAPSFSCTNNFTPGIVLKNQGSNPIYSLTIIPAVDGVNNVPINWTGTLAIGANTTIIGNAIAPLTSGGHLFSYSVTSVNGNNDNNGVNNSESSPLYLVSAYSTTQVAEQFATPQFPPINWGIINTNKGPSWDPISTINGTSQISGIGVLKYDFFNNSIKGDKDELLLPPLNASFFNTAGLLLNFDVAYAQYTNDDDRLDVMVSDNCGLNWINVYSKSGSNLATGSAQTTAFTPNANQWRKESIFINGFNLSNLLIKLVTTSDFGNNLYLDNLNLKEANPAGLKSPFNKAIGVSVSPNPANDILQLQINAAPTTTKIKFINTIGQTVLFEETLTASGTSFIEIKIHHLPSGIYTLLIDSNNEQFIRKIVINR
jgi:hypothetical protein